MDVLLAGVALFSLLLAAAMSAVAWKLLRDNRRHSAARAEALADLAWSFNDEPEDASHARLDAAPARLHTAHTRPDAAYARLDAARADTVDAVDRALDREGIADHFRPASAPLNAPIDEIDAIDARVYAPSMFASVDAVRQGRRLVWIAGACAVVAAATAAIVAFEKRGALEFLEGLTAVVANAEHRTSRASAPAEPPLDLLSLNHVVEPDGSFVVRGLVQSRDNAVPAGVVAVVYVFDGEGRFLATASAALERQTLARGEQSAFEVRVTPSTPARIARYRIGFRTDDAGVVPHRDARPPYRVDPNQPSAPAPGVREGART